MIKRRKNYTPFILKHCKKCGKIFKRKGKFTKICDNCHELALKKKTISKADNYVYRIMKLKRIDSKFKLI